MTTRELKPMGAVLFLGRIEPVIWERETEKYVFNIKRLERKGDGWEERRRYYDDKMDKEEIIAY